LVIFNIEESTGSQDSGKKKKKKKKKKKGKQFDQLVVFTFYFPPPVKPIDWFDDLSCLSMQNQPIMIL
jgi:hypothetical protein